VAETLADMVRRWDLSGTTTTDGGLFNQVHERIEFLRRVHFDQYLPTLGSDQVTDFETRLETWINHLPDDTDKQILFEFVPDIIFFGREEFGKLYQAALRGPITRWVIDQTGLNFGSAGFDATLAEEVHKHTWYCSVSDSMQISDFCHANHIGGINYRPDLRTLGKFGDFNKILSFMRDHQDANGSVVPLKRIVVLEDFIGSGTQLNDAEVVINQLLAHPVPVLLVPLIICPDGVTTIQRMFGANALFRFDPILQLHEELFINSRTSPPPNSLYGKMKNLVQLSYPLVVGNNAALPRPYGAFGFSDTGALVVLYSNAPANTLPIVQHSSNTWWPLFPRSARVK
jgi:hypothetical protein